MKISKHVLTALLSLTSLAFADGKPRLTLDEFFNSVSYPTIAISPDGSTIVIETERADWDQKIFRTDLWLYRDDAKGGSLIQLTQSGHDTEPKWSPDGRWIAFLSERKPSSEKGSDSSDDKDKNKAKDDKGETAQIYLISPTGGEAIPLTEGEEEVHTFSWSADSRTLYFATRNPWTKAQKDDYKKQWKDVVQYRTAERGDTLFALDVPAALAHHAPAKLPEKEKDESDAAKHPDLTPGARAIATLPLRIEGLITSPDGSKLAFVSNAINQRQEKPEDVEIYAVDLVARAPSPATAGSETKPTAQPHQLTHNQAVETKLHWANDNRHVFFTVEIGDVTGPYRDLQPHLYWVDSEKPDSEPGAVEQWSKDFIGPVDHYAVTADNVLASARLGTEVSMYSVAQPSQSLHKLNGWEGTYEIISATPHSPRVAFVYSSLQKPAEIYLAESADKLDQSRPITSFNKLFTERDLPQGKPYHWKADDGTTVEGMLIYPPGKFEAKHLPMFTFIHGGPADADGNHFEADWYQWSALAATNGWLVFEPNYRGSTGYGDKFLAQIVPQIVSRPGKDILEGVDAPGERRHRRSRPSHHRRLQLRRLHDQLAHHANHALQSRRHRRGRGRAHRQLGQRRHHLRRRLLPRRTPLGSPAALSRRSRHLPNRQSQNAHPHGRRRRRHPRRRPGRLSPRARALFARHPERAADLPRRRPRPGQNPWHGKIKVREELKWLQKYGGVPAGN